MQNAQVNAYTCVIYFSQGIVSKMISFTLFRGNFFDSDALFLLNLSVGVGVGNSKQKHFEAKIK